MITYDASAFCAVLFRLDGSVIPRVIPRALIFAVLGGVATAVHWHLCGEDWDSKDCAYNAAFDASADLHVYISGIIGLLLVFRTNSSYARYDKGVEAVGKLRIAARIIVSQACSYVDAPDAETRCETIEEIRRLTMVYCLLFKRHVHEQNDVPLDKGRAGRILSRSEQVSLMSCQKNPSTRAVLVTNWLRQSLMKAKKAGILDSCALQMMDNTVSSMVENFQLGCRIAFVPMPFAYAQCVKWIMTLFCAITPFAYVSDLHFGTPVAAFIVALIIFSVDEIGVEIEDPFGDDSADLDLNLALEEIDEQAAELVAQATNTSLNYIFDYEEESSLIFHAARRADSPKARLEQARAASEHWKAQTFDKDKSSDVNRHSRKKKPKRDMEPVVESRE